jgi:hypothetical protein
MRMKPARYLITTALASIVAVWVVGAGAPAYAAPGAPMPQPPGNTTTGGKPVQRGTSGDAELLAKQNQLLPLAQSLVRQSRAADSDISGVSLDVKADTIHVYRTDRGKQLRFDTAVPAGVTVTVHPGRFSRTAMTAAADRVTREAKLLSEQKVAVQAVGPTVDGSGITVTVLVKDAKASAERDQAAATLRARYGDIVATVNGTERQKSEKDLFYSGWRFNDYPAWYGGDRIASSSSGCTGGFAAWFNGPAMLTAAHCGPVGTAWYNGPTTGNTFNYIGNTVYSDTATDVAAISVSSMSNYINVGPADGATSQLYIGSWASPVVGQYLCQSGSYTGEVCSLYVVDTAQYVCLSWFIFCLSWQGPLADVVHAYGPSYYAAGYGDSGGPVYSYSGVAYGLVHGTLTPNAAAAYPAWAPVNLWCPAPEGWSVRCSAGFSFAHMPGY